MKRIKKSFYAIFVLTSILCFTTNLIAQVLPFNYQAVVRDASGSLICNEEIEIELSVIKGSADGEMVYTETNNLTTNSLGLVNIQVGASNLTDFANINWATGPYFINVKVNDTDMGTSQIVSVPFAMYAANIDTARFSSYNDLKVEGKLDNDDSKDILTRLQADNRYSPYLNFFASNYANDDYTVSTQKVEFDNIISGTDLFYIKNQDRYLAFFKGVYHFSTSVCLENLTDGSNVILWCYVNGASFCTLSSMKVNGTNLTITGSVSLELNIGDYVEIYVFSGDPTFTIVGESMFNRTHFSGYLAHRIF